MWRIAHKALSERGEGGMRLSVLPATHLPVSQWQVYWPPLVPDAGVQSQPCPSARGSGFGSTAISFRLDPTQVWGRVSFSAPCSRESWVMLLLPPMPRWCDTGHIPQANSVQPWRLKSAQVHVPMQKDFISKGPWDFHRVNPAWCNWEQNAALAIMRLGPLCRTRHSVLSFPISSPWLLSTAPGEIVGLGGGGFGFLQLM